MGARAPRAAEDAHARRGVQERRQGFDFGGLGRHGGPGRDQRLGRRRGFGRLQRHVARQDDHRDAPLAYRFADRGLDRPGHLPGAGDQFAVVAAFLEEVLRVGLLEVAGADLGRGNVRRDRQHGQARAMAVEQPVDEVQIARPAAAGADRQGVGQMGLGPGREGGHLLVTHVNPFDLALATDRVGQAVQAVADDAVDALNPGGGEGFGELIGDGAGHRSSPGLRRRRFRRLWPGSACRKHLRTGRFVRLEEAGQSRNFGAPGSNKGHGALSGPPRGRLKGVSDGQKDSNLGGGRRGPGQQSRRSRAGRRTGAGASCRRFICGAAGAHPQRRGAAPAGRRGGRRATAPADPGAIRPASSPPPPPSSLQPAMVPPTRILLVGRRLDSASAPPPPSSPPPQPLLTNRRPRGRASRQTVTERPPT